VEERIKSSRGGRRSGSAGISITGAEKGRGIIGSE